jgi:UDP:flavonoid glycosyltransferase YjiC (YdhE family)
MKILLASLGTAGDVHPFLAIGRHLAGRGHDVELLSCPAYAPLAAAAGIAFTGVGGASDLDTTLGHHYVWHPVNGFGVMWRHLARPAMADTYRRIEAVFRARPCVLVYSPFLMPAARIANEKLGVKAISAYTAPAMIRNHYPPVSIAHWQLPRWTPRAVCKQAWELLDRRKMQPLALPAVEAMRASLGLAPLEQSIFGEWIHAPERGITLFPRWFAAATPDWPGQILQTGFPLFDGDAGAGLSPATEGFLSSGTPPLVFTAGSAMRQAGDFFRAAVAASGALGERALLMSDAADQVPEGLPASVRHTRYEPFSLLLPRSRAFIHHGGIGSSAQALRAGVPQLVVPHAYDQFDNARRLEQLGVARILGRNAAGPRALQRKLRALLHTSAVASACARVAARFSGDEAMQSIQHAIEEFA